MGFIDFIKSTRNKLTKEIRLFNPSDMAPQESLPVLPTWLFNPQLGMPRNINLPEVRQYAKSPWVQMVTNAISKQIMTTEWDIIVADEEDQTDYSADIEKLRTLLQSPNRNGATFWDIWVPFLRDVLEIDAGVVFKGRNLAGELVELFTHDGGRFLINVDEHGIIGGDDENGEERPAYYQYSFRQIQGAPIPFKRNEIIYGRVNTNTEFAPYGYSPLQSIQQEVEVMIQSTRYNKEFFKNNAMPDGMITAEMTLDNLRDFKHAWEQEMRGKAHKLAFLNSDAKFTPMALSNKDMDWLEGQKWYFHIVFGAYGLSPQEVGFYENSNKSTGESQERITIKNAIKPYLTLIEQKINCEIRNELIGHDKIKFEWFTKDDAAEKVEHEQMMAKLNASVLTINEVRAMEGLDPVEWGDQPMSMVMQDRMIEQGDFDDKKDNPKDKEKEDDKKDNPKDKEKEDNKRDNPKDRDKKKEEREEKKEAKVDIQKQIIDEGEDVIEEAEDYADFLTKKFNGWEKSILGFLEETIKDEIQKDYVVKSFGEFIRRLLNSVNTTRFMTGLQRVIRIDVKKGVEAAEEELNMDIGISLDFNREIKQLADRQLEGFTIDGKRWKGIKGVSIDVQNKVSKIVADGISGKQSLSDISKEIKTMFTKLKGGEVNGKVTKGRVMKIARTESNRFINHGRLESYKKSGLKGKKKWRSFIDKNTTDICKELNNQAIELNDVFETKDGKQFDQPPHGPNCRSIIQFVVD
jgi:HK97 family phage portal protein